MNPTIVPIVVAIIGVIGTIGVAIIQTRQNRRVEKNTNRITEQEKLLAKVLADLEHKERRLRRFESFFRAIGLSVPGMLKEKFQELEDEQEQARGTYGDSDNE